MSGSIRTLAVVSALVTSAFFLSSCGTTSTRALPAYEPPVAKSNFQNIRTTAYTDTEADHLEYTNHNALGGELHAAGPPIHRAENNPRRLTLALETASQLQPFSLESDQTRTKKPRAVKREVRTTRTTKIVRGRRVVVVSKPQPPQIGSAAADWSRWPAGTTFRIVSTGQIYRVDDYGWALAGRNTIDLYVATPGEMNAWGARDETIEILQWGDPAESLRRLAPHQSYKHIRRMVLELQGEENAAARLR